MVPCIFSAVVFLTVCPYYLSSNNSTKIIEFIQVDGFINRISIERGTVLQNTSNLYCSAICVLSNEDCVSFFFNDKEGSCAQFPVLKRLEETIEKSGWIYYQKLVTGGSAPTESVSSVYELTTSDSTASGHSASVSTASEPRTSVSTASLSTASEPTASVSTASVSTASVSTASVTTASVSTAPVSTASEPTASVSTASKPTAPVSTASKPPAPVSTTSEPTAPVSTASEPTAFTCPTIFGYYSDPEGCTSFYQCDNWVAKKHDCPESQGFDPSISVCTWKTSIPGCT